MYRDAASFPLARRAEKPGMVAASGIIYKFRYWISRDARRQSSETARDCSMSVSGRDAEHACQRIYT